MHGYVPRNIETELNKALTDAMEQLDEVEADRKSLKEKLVQVKAELSKSTESAQSFKEKTRLKKMG